MLNEPESQRQAQAREQEEPTERSQPIPVIVAIITLAVVLSGVAYIVVSEPFGRADLGDRRTVADLMAKAPGAPGAAGQAVDGKALYAGNCAACHQATGKGLPGVFPPLDGSEWVQGDPRVLVNILLHGITGEIEVAGTAYKGQTPPFKQLGDAELAAIASAIRSEWSNKAAAITPEQFAAERKDTRRSTPFPSGAELKALPAAQ